MESVLQEADRLINGDRRGSYGHPLDDYTRTAGLINAALAHKLKEQFTAEDVMLCMVLVKISRFVHQPEHRDSLVDAAGYLGCIELATDERKARDT